MTSAKYGKPFILLYGPPLGIAYLESTLDKHGFVVKAIDMFDYSWDKVKQTLAGTLLSLAKAKRQ